MKDEGEVTYLSMGKVKAKVRKGRTLGIEKRTRRGMRWEGSEATMISERTKNIRGRGLNISGRMKELKEDLSRGKEGKRKNV